MRIPRTSLVALACAALAAVGCAGDGSAASPGPAAPPASSVSAAPPPGGGAAVGTFRACHKHRDGSLVLILLFENRDRALLGGFPGALAFGVEPAEPTTWDATGDRVEVDPGVNEHVRQITVPAEQSAPSDVTLSVTTTAAVDDTNVLATNDVTIPVPASACSSA
jgi:hypothetical protein